MGDGASQAARTARAAYILDGASGDDRSDDRSGGRSNLGGKAAALADLAGSGLPIPAWFVVSPTAFDASLTRDQRAALDNARDAQSAQAALADLSLRAASPFRPARRAQPARTAGRGGGRALVRPV